MYHMGAETAAQRFQTLHALCLGPGQERDAGLNMGLITRDDSNCQLGAGAAHPAPQLGVCIAVRVEIPAQGYLVRDLSSQ